MPWVSPCNQVSYFHQTHSFAKKTHDVCNETPSINTVTLFCFRRIIISYYTDNVCENLTIKLAWTVNCFRTTLCLGSILMINPENQGNVQSASRWCQNWIGISGFIMTKNHMLATCVIINQTNPQIWTHTLEKSIIL